MRKPLAVLFLVLFSVVLFARPAFNGSEHRQSYVIARNPLFGSQVFPDMATAKRVAPALALIHAQVQCGQDAGCYVMANHITYEVVVK